jgi:Ca2+:H+ antiporter
MSRWLYILLVFAVLAPIVQALGASPIIVFFVAGLGILPFAALIGQSIEQIAEHTGEQIGGLLFATFGNAPELIIGIFALRQGLIDVVRASIIGSVLGNVLLVLGVAVCVGGFKHGRLPFQTRHVNQYGSLLALSIGGLLLPTVADLLARYAHQSHVIVREDSLSVFVAIILLLSYIASMLFSVFHVRNTEVTASDMPEPLVGARSAEAISRLLLAYRSHLAQSGHLTKTGELSKVDSVLQALIEPELQATHSPASIFTSTPPRSHLFLALALLAIATAGVAWLSDILVGAITPLTLMLHWNNSFVGLIFVPLIGGLPEYFNTISMALQKRVDMILAASAGSSIQIALLMAPILVLVSLLTPSQLGLDFGIVELAVLAIAVFLFSEITKDGELVWLEGLLLILLYCIMGGTVFLFGT